MISDFLDLLMTIFLSDFVELDWFVRHTTETINNIPLCRIHQFIENSNPRYGRKLQKKFHLERSWHWALKPRRRIPFPKGEAISLGGSHITSFTWHTQFYGKLFVQGVFFTGPPLKVPSVRLHCKSCWKSSECQNFLRVIFRVDQ